MASVKRTYQGVRISRVSDAISKEPQMTKILHVNCSPRGQAAESYRLSQKIIRFLLESEPTAVLVNREIGGGAISLSMKITRFPRHRPLTFLRRAPWHGPKNSFRNWRVRTLW